MTRTLPGIAALLLLPMACSKAPPAATPQDAAATAPTAAQAAAFVKAKDAELRKVWVDQQTAAWNYETDIRPQTEAPLTVANEAEMAFFSTSVPQATRMLQAEGLDPDTKRQLELLRRGMVLPAPSDPVKRRQLAEISAKLGGMYGTGQLCTGVGEAKTCQDLGDFEQILANDRDWDHQLAAWRDWRTISVPMKPMYADFVRLGNEGAREVGYDDMGVLWKSGYDMPPDQVEAEVDRLWGQLKPLYEQLHCAVRAELVDKYGADKVKPDGLIPAHVTGNMWAQSWDNLYPWMEPYQGQPSIDVTEAIVAKGWDEREMVRHAEAFFTSMGLAPLPDSFWQRSMFTQPEGKEVVCHASAWDLTYADDVRIKMCIKPTMEDFITIHHELGHDYYYMNYYQLPVLYQAGANDGFHEAVGDTIALSITPAYLHEIGLLDQASSSQQALINKQMQLALDKIAFLPFGRMIDQWRWDVFSGAVGTDQYNAHWWELRAKYQGIGAPEPRDEQWFDPGAKYHIPANTPYIRYFLAYVLQFQFHKALCDASGFEGPLYACSNYGSKAAGDKLGAMLKLGASEPWPDALEAIAGTRELDAQPLVDYFQPLMTYLEAQNKGRSCGW